MAPDYKLTKFYYFQVGEDRYYGFTTKTLEERTRGHRNDFRDKPNRKVYAAMREACMGPNDIKLVLVEEYPCENLEQALERERYWVERHGALNTCLPYRTEEERRQYDLNRNGIRAETRRNRYENDEEFREREKDWQRKYRAERVKCDGCGKEMRRGSLPRHQQESCEATASTRPPKKKAGAPRMLERPPSNPIPAPPPRATPPTQPNHTPNPPQPPPKINKTTTPSTQTDTKIHETLANILSIQIKDEKAVKKACLYLATEVKCDACHKNVARVVLPVHKKGGCRPDASGIAYFTLPKPQTNDVIPFYFAV
jgi:hypothetical protein